MEKFKKVRTLKDIKNDPRVHSIHKEQDPESWWCYLRAGWQWDNNQQHTIHEPTIKGVCDELNLMVTEWPDDPGLSNPKLV